MSQEIRTPMNGVLGILDALLHSRLTGEQARHVETARRSAESLLTIVDDVLEFSEIAAGPFVSPMPSSAPAAAAERAR